jgi:dTMP kinase
VRNAGFFLVIEGPEGAGKSTLVRGLTDRFAGDGTTPVVVREPGGTPAAEALRAELLADGRAWTPEAELLYICAARADLVAKVIRPALAEGRVVLSDRFDLSTKAYQVAGRGLPEDMVAWVNRAATGGLEADLTLVLDLPPSVGRDRQLAAGKARDRLDRESAEFHERIGAAYRAASGPGVVHLDASLAAAELLERAWRAVTGAGAGAVPRGSG